jgi:MFS transporter, DHA2 family, multidrug resistance protein
MPEDAGSSVASQGEKKASAADWIAVLAGALGALLATLDISIVNSALPQIQGQIGASGTEGTWIATGYLVAEVVAIPLTAWLMRMTGLRSLLLGCALLFTLFSIVCGLSNSLAMMIVGRMGQGFAGGFLIPTAQTIIRTRLPRSQIPIGMSIFGLIVLLGPLAGPLLGGWLTDNYSWRWCFFLNIPVTMTLVTLLLLGLPHEKGKIEELFEADWLGILGLGACLGSLTVVLEEGQRERWFDSDLITILAAVSFLGLLLLLFAQATAVRPVVKLRLLLNRSYASVIIIVIAIGAGLYGNSYALPQFLSGIAGYDASQSGRVLLVSGIPAILMMPVLPRLLGRVDTRVLVPIGLLAFASGCFLNTRLTSQDVGAAFLWPQLLTGVGMMLAMFPLNQASVGAVPPADAADAAGLYNMARNLGGSLGLAALGIVIDRRTELHADMIRESLTANSPFVQERLAAMTSAFMQMGTDPAYARRQALAQLAAQIHIQGLTMTYADCFWLSSVALFACIPLVALLKPPPSDTHAATADVH